LAFGFAKLHGHLIKSLSSIKSVLLLVLVGGSSNQFPIVLPGIHFEIMMFISFQVGIWLIFNHHCPVHDSNHIPSHMSIASQVHRQFPHNWQIVFYY